MVCYLRCVNNTHSPLISVHDENSVIFSDIKQHKATQFIPYRAGTSYLTATDVSGREIDTVHYGFLPGEQYTVEFY